MRSLKPHYIYAQNILCFGPEGIEIKFDDYGQIVQVIGINLDAPASEDRPASNAAGKSSIQELLSIALYGKTVKSPKKNKNTQIMNVLANKAKIEFWWDDYRVIRTYTKSKSGQVSSKVELWKSADHIWDEKSCMTKTLPDVKVDILREIGLSHHAFCNVVVSDDSNTYSFLESELPEKRLIVENLLDLDQYRGYHDNCKEYVKDVKKKVDLFAREYTILLSEVDACIRRISTVKQQEVNWRATKTNEVSSLRFKIEEKQKQLETTDIGQQLIAWEKSRERLNTLTDEITETESSKIKIQAAVSKLKDMLTDAQDKRMLIKQTISEHIVNITSMKKDIERDRKTIQDLESNKDGTLCSSCYSVVNRDNYGHVLSDKKESVDKLMSILSAESSAALAEEEKLKLLNESLSQKTSMLTEAESKITKYDHKINANRREINELSKLSKPEGNVQQQIIESEIISLKKQLKDRLEELEGQSPYKEIIEQATAELALQETNRDEKTTQLQEAEKELLYYQYWQEAFGDNGIRKSVIDGIIPSLNMRIAHWLQILTGGLIELTFDNVFQETITRKDNPAFYESCSNAERRKINLAVSQAFAYVMILNTGVCPGIVFLDEITGGAIDRASIPGVHNMIFELAKERQVFVTTHNETLMSLLEGAETITLKKQNDITVLAS